MSLYYHHAKNQYTECYAECHYAECHYADCHYADCRHADCRYTECHYAECHYAECCHADCRSVTEKAFLLVTRGLSYKTFYNCC